MPRPKKPPRLWFDEGRGSWVIRDGAIKIRTGCAREEAGQAEQHLADYIDAKYQPPASGTRAATVAVTDVLLAYADEHTPKSADSVRTKASNLRFLNTWWGGKTVADITAKACRAYAAQRPQSSARRELETLNAALHHWHKEHGPLDTVPAITLPERAKGRERYLPRSEAARLLLGALGWQRDPSGTTWIRHRDLIHRHVARFIVIGLHTGTRHTAILKLRWEENEQCGWVDLKHRVLHRKGAEEVETKKRRPKIRIGRKLLGHLQRWKKIDRKQSAGPATIVHWEGQEIDKLRRSWETARRLAGLDDAVTPHTLRHTRATWMMQRGDDPWKAAGFLGMSVQVLQSTYGHHHPDWQGEVSE
jgi:integrase